MGRSDTEPVQNWRMDTPVLESWISVSAAAPTLPAITTQSRPGTAESFFHWKRKLSMRCKSFSWETADQPL